MKFHARCWLFSLWLLLPLPNFAHEGLHEQIQAATQAISLHPRAGDLYLKRAELYRLHHEWKAALADYKRAQKFAPNLLEIEFCRGRMWFEAGDYAAAQKALNYFLKVVPAHGEAWLYRARAVTKLQSPQQAAQAYEQAFQRLAHPTPDHYIERLHVQLAAGQTQLALQGLEAGMQRLGALITLQIPALELELKQQQWDAALTRLTKIAAASPRQESWLLRRGEILLQAGRPAAAQTVLLAAQRALETLPPAQRQTKAMHELSQRIQAAIAQVTPR